MVRISDKGNEVSECSNPYKTFRQAQLPDTGELHMFAKRFPNVLVLFLGVCFLFMAASHLRAQGTNVERLAAAVSENSADLNAKRAFVERGLVVNSNPRTDIEISLKTDNPSLKPGDELRFTVGTDRDCYLTVLYPSESGNVIVLWPNDESGWNNRVTANTPIRIPGPDSSIHIKVDGTAPYERILAVASSEPHGFFRDRDYVDQPGQPVKALAFRSKELVAELRSRADAFSNSLKWGTAQLVVHVAASRTGRGAFVSSLSPKDATLLTVKNLNKAITAKGYDWVAGVTSLSELSHDQMTALCGDREKPRERDATRRKPMDEEVKEILETDKSDRPTKWDWRNVNGQNWTTPIRNQSSCGSCQTFAATAVVEMAWQIFEKKAYSGIHLSESQIFFCGCGKCCKSGWYTEDALDFAKRQGVLEESVYPYRPHDQDCGAEICPSSPNGQQKTQIADWVKISDAEGAKNWLSQVGPVTASMAVYEDFQNYKSGVYKHTTGKDCGGHAITIVGYDDEEGVWICKNSWGTDWGDNGWFKIAYDQCEIGSTRRPFYGVKAPISRK